MKILKMIGCFILGTSLIGNIVLGIIISDLKKSARQFFGISTVQSDESYQQTTADKQSDTQAGTQQKTTQQEKSEKAVEIIQKYTVEDSESPLILYLGNSPAQWEEIPTWTTWTESQQKAWITDYKGTGEHGWNNDSRRLFSGMELKEIEAEYEKDGQIKNRKISFEKVDESLWRIDPYFRVGMVEGKIEHWYVTFKITTVDEQVFYMTWVPYQPEE